MTKPDPSPGEKSPGDKDASGGEGAQAKDRLTAQKKPGKDKKPSADKRPPAQKDEDLDAIVAEALVNQPAVGADDVESARSTKADDLDAIVAEAIGTGEVESAPLRRDDVREAAKRSPTDDIFYLDMGDLNALAADELTRVAAERDEYLSALQRLKADFDNNRKRTLRQQTEILERANQSLLTKLLPVLDALDLAMVHASESGEDEDARAIVQIATLLRNTLATEGLERIDAVNAPFDPTIHDAVAREPVSDEDGNAGQTVSNIMRAGYKLKGRVIRPAMVMVRG
jgi:molecular chaperone GrpE